MLFRSLGRARDEFSDRVIRRSVRAPRGEPRVRALFENWLDVGDDGAAPCLFASVSMEFDDQPGVVRDQVVQDHTDFAEAVQQIFRTGISEGHFRADADDIQFQHDLHGIMLGHFHACRLLQEADAEARARTAFERLLDAVRVTG